MPIGIGCDKEMQRQRAGAPTASFKKEETPKNREQEAKYFNLGKEARQRPIPSCDVLESTLVRDIGSRVPCQAGPHANHQSHPVLRSPAVDQAR